MVALGDVAETVHIVGVGMQIEGIAGSGHNFQRSTSSDPLLPDRPTF